MASVTYGKYVFGLRDLKITNLAGTLQEDLDASQELTFTPEFRVGEQFGDDALKAVISFIIGGTASITGGSMSSAAMAIATGRTLTTSGSSPNEVTELKLSAGDNMPYFKIYGKAVDEGSGDMFILLAKCKITGGLAFTFQDNEFLTPGFEVRCVDDGSNGVAKIIQHETATTLPTS